MKEELLKMADEANEPKVKEFIESMSEEQLQSMLNDRGTISQEIWAHAIKRAQAEDRDVDGLMMMALTEAMTGKPFARAGIKRRPELDIGFLPGGDPLQNGNIDKLEEFLFDRQPGIGMIRLNNGPWIDATMGRKVSLMFRHTGLNMVGVLDSFLKELQTRNGLLIKVYQATFVFSLEGGKSGCVLNTERSIKELIDDCTDFVNSEIVSIALAISTGTGWQEHVQMTKELIYSFKGQPGYDYREILEGGKTIVERLGKDLAPNIMSVDLNSGVMRRRRTPAEGHPFGKGILVPLPYSGVNLKLNTPELGMDPENPLFQLRGKEIELPTKGREEFPGGYRKNVPSVKEPEPPLNKADGSPNHVAWIAWKERNYPGQFYHEMLTQFHELRQKAREAASQPGGVPFDGDTVSGLSDMDHRLMDARNMMAGYSSTPSARGKSHSELDWAVGVMMENMTPRLHRCRECANKNVGESELSSLGQRARDSLDGVEPYDIGNIPHAGDSLIMKMLKESIAPVPGTHAHDVHLAQQFFHRQGYANTWLWRLNAVLEHHGKSLCDFDLVYHVLASDLGTDNHWGDVSDVIRRKIQENEGLLSVRMKDKTLHAYGKTARKLVKQFIKQQKE